MKTEKTALKELERDRCAHHWIIAGAHGETSGARCKKCGVEAEFYNHADWYTHQPGRSTGRPRRDQRRDFQEPDIEDEANWESLIS